MATLLTRLASRAPRPLLAVCLLATVALGLYALSVPDRLALGGGAFEGSDSELADSRLSEDLGYRADADYLLVVSSVEPLSGAANALALQTLLSQLEAIDGVAAASAEERTEDDLVAEVEIHLQADADAETTTAVGEALWEDLDPGPLQVLIGGSYPTADGAREQVLDDAPRLLLLAAPLLLLILAVGLGLRIGLATLVGSLFGLAATVSALGLLAEFTDVYAVALVPALLVALVAGVQAAAALVFRYREESATLGAGPEALEYASHLVLRGIAIGALTAAAAGISMSLIGVEFVRSVGQGIAIGAILGPLLAVLPVAAAISLRAEAERGTALPLVSVDSPTGEGSRGFRFLLGAARRRRRALLGLVPLLAVIVVAIPLADSKSVGLTAYRLDAEAGALVAEDALKTAFAPGSSGPLLVAVPEPPDSLEVLSYADQIAAIDGVADVGAATAAGAGSVLEVDLAVRPRSPAAQEIAAGVAALPAPSERAISGPAVELADAAQGLADDGPLLVLGVLLGAGLLWTLLLRSAFAPLIALGSAVAPAVGLGAMVFVFGDGRLSELLDYPPSGAAHLSSYVLVAAPLLAIALFAGAQTASALREERVLGGGAAGSIARSVLLTLKPAAVGTLLALVAGAVWLGSDFLPAKEIALGLGAGLLADLLLTRVLIAPALARLSIGRDR